MTIKDAYQKYLTPKNLQEHMLRVAALSKIITDNWTGKPVDGLAIVKAAAMHDISKPMNFDTSPETQKKYGMSKEDVEKTEKIKNFIKDNYGTNEHKAAILMCNELGFGETVADILNNLEWEYMERHVQEKDFNSGIALYCDMRIGPKGILPLKSRFDDLIARGRGDHHAKYYPAAKTFEELVQKNTNVDLNKIAYADLEELFPQILNLKI